MSGAVEALSEIFAHYKHSAQAPGHSHDIPGIWDKDIGNGDKGGTACEWCATWERARAARTTPPARTYAEGVSDEDVARIIDPLAWQERERLLVRKAEWEARPAIEGVDFVAIYGRDADAQVAPSLAKAAAIRLLSQGGGKA